MSSHATQVFTWADTGARARNNFNDSHQLGDPTLQVACVTHDELCRLLEYRQMEVEGNSPSDVEWRTYAGHNCVVNFDNTTTDTTTGTVEFRQHDGTLDVSTIIAWVSAVTSLVRFCQGVYDPQVVQLCAKARDLDFQLPDMLRYNGCPAEAVAHYERHLDPSTFQAALSHRQSLARPSIDNPAIQALWHLKAMAEYAGSKPQAVATAIKAKLKNGGLGVQGSGQANEERMLAAYDAAAKTDTGSQDLTSKAMAFRSVAHQSRQDKPGET